LRRDPLPSENRLGGDNEKQGQENAKTKNGKKGQQGKAFEAD
jgi:hypothetical protein